MVGCPEIADHLLGPANDHRKSQRQYEVQWMRLSCFSLTGGLLQLLLADSLAKAV